MAEAISKNFISTYLCSIKSKNSIAYELLYTEQRKNILLDLREEPMGRTHILELNNVCKNILNVNFVELCIFSLTSLVNKSEDLADSSENILQKIITLTSGDKKMC